MPPLELGAYNATPPQADGYYAIGDIRRLKGDFEGAQQALREAHARGKSPQPALALVRLAEGNVKAASSAINAAVAEETWDRWARARLLPAQVEIAIAAGDVAGARTAVDALGEIVADYPSPAFESGPPGRPRPRPPGRGRCVGRDPGAAPGDQGLARRGCPVRGGASAGHPVARAAGRRRRGWRGSRARSGACLVRPARRARGHGGSRARAARRHRSAQRTPDRHEDVHVHRHRRLDDPGRGPRRPGVGGRPAESRRHAPRQGCRRGRGGRQLHRRRFLRRLRRGPRGASTARSGSSRRCAICAPRSASPARCGSGSTPQQRTGAAAITAGRASTWRPGSPLSPRAARSWPAPRRSRQAGKVATSEPRTATVKGVAAPVTFAAITWS